jgi:hypothetical protein
MIVNTSIEGTTRRLTELLSDVHLPDGFLQWQARLLSVDSGHVTHVFVPHGVETSTPALWQAILESSLAQLSMQAEISKLQSQIESLKNEQQDLGSEIEDGEARSRWLETPNQQQQQQQFGSSAGSPVYFDRSSSSDPQPTYFSSSTRHTSRRSRPQSSRASSTSTLNPFNTSILNPFNTSTLNPFNTSNLNPFRPFSTSSSQATLNLFPPDSPSAVTSSLGRAPTPPSDRDDSISYAIRLQHEFDNENRTLSDFTSAAESSTGRAPGRPRRATRAPTAPSDYDDSILYAMRLQREFDNEDRALSAELAELATPGRPGRATRAPTPPSDRDDGILYAMRLQHEFDNEDRTLSAQRAKLATTSDRDDSIFYAMRLQHEFDNEDLALSAQRTELAKSAQRLFECGVCMEEMPYDSVARPDPCGHTFCRECLRGHVAARLDERKFPILCPTCTVNKGKGKGVDGGACRSWMVLLTIISHYVSLSGLAVHCFKPRTHRQAIQCLDRDGNGWGLCSLELSEVR